MLDERKVRLQQLYPVANDRVEYPYDFGDSWRHVLEWRTSRASQPG
jgi:hypothetical protein